MLDHIYANAIDAMQSGNVKAYAKAWHDFMAVVDSIDLDETFTDHEQFTGNQAKRLRNEIESLGQIPSFRVLLEMSEVEVSELLLAHQIGAKSRYLANKIRAEDSPWSIALRAESLELA